MALTLADVARHLLAALAAGSAVGIERSFHGRPAGFRTHALVCLASSALMLVTLSEGQWLRAFGDAIRMDPTRMAQGIMTGIGFLGAGVIFKEGLTVRGLTTAASIWITAAIGILMGIGLYAPGVMATVLTVGVLSIFRLLEIHLPSQLYALNVVRFARGSVMPEPELRRLLADNGFSVAGVTYSLADAEQEFEYRMTVWTTRRGNAAGLAAALGALPTVRGFAITPQGD